MNKGRTDIIVWVSFDIHHVVVETVYDDVRMALGDSDLLRLVIGGFRIITGIGHAILKAVVGIKTVVHGYASQHLK